MFVQLLEDVMCLSIIITEVEHSVLNYFYRNSEQYHLHAFKELWSVEHGIYWSFVIK